MKQTSCRIICFFILLFFFSSKAFAWNDRTHLAIAKAAGYACWYNAAGADIIKLKAGETEKYNHIYQNLHNLKITPALVLAQAEKYNDPADAEGHLYGAVIAAVRNFRASTDKPKYKEYHIALCAHYVGDLSQPLHNIEKDALIQKRHYRNDDLLEAEVFDHIDTIQKAMYAISLRPDHFEEDLAPEIARIATISRQLALVLQKEGRDMTRAEAYAQLGHSASLFRAILVCLGKTH